MEHDIIKKLYRLIYLVNVKTLAIRRDPISSYEKNCCVKAILTFLTVFLDYASTQTNFRRELVKYETYFICNDLFWSSFWL